MREFVNFKYFSIFFTLLYFSAQIAAKRNKPPEVDEEIRTQFKIPAGTKPFKLSCPVKNGEEDGIMVRWSKDDEEISSADWGSSPYRLVNSNLDLKIRNPQVSDSGHYKCMAINGFGHKKVEFTLQVYDANFIQKQDPIESILLSEQASSPIWHDRNAIDFAVKKPVRLSRGQRLELRCPASGNPLPKIYWSKNGARINIELINPTSAKFVIDNVDVGDSGIYACRLENSYGSLEADFRVYISAFDDNDDDFAGLQNGHDNLPSAGTFGSEVVKSGSMSVPPLPQPTIDQPYNTTIRAGNIAQFQCKVQWRKDAPTIRWLRKIDNPAIVRTITPNATILHINDMHLMVLEQNEEAVQLQDNNNNNNKNEGAKSFLNKLLITNVQPHDSGRYFCVVTNAVGQFVFRSVYLEVIEAGSYSPLTNSMNVIIAVVIALVLAVVTLAVVWLCYNSTSDTAVKNISLVAPHQFSSTSSTSSSTSSAEKYPKSLSTALITTEPATVDVHTFNGAEGLKRAIFSEPPPPPPQIPIPQAPMISQANANLSNTVISPQQQLIFHQQQILQQQQQQRLLENHLAHHSQVHLHHDVSSPLLNGSPHHPSHHLQNTSIGELLYPSSMTLDRRYPNQQRMNPIFNPYVQQQQHTLHRTKAEDEMSRLSSHIYDLLAVSSPLPPHNAISPSLVRHHQQNNNNNNNHFSHNQQQDQPDWNCANKYAPPPAPPLPPSLPPPPHARPTTPVSTIGESEDSRRFVQAENASFTSQTSWNNPNIPESARQFAPNTSKLLQEHQFHHPKRHTQISVGDGISPR